MSKLIRLMSMDGVQVVGMAILTVAEMVIKNSGICINSWRLCRSVTVDLSSRSRSQHEIYRSICNIYWSLTANVRR